MGREKSSQNKISRPAITGAMPRERLFSRIDDARQRPLLWVSAPGGSGKTTLIASYLETRALPCLWYQVDQEDSDIAAFFQFLAGAAQKAAPRNRKPLPPFSLEQMLALPVFSRRWFESLFARLPRPSAVVFDNVQDAYGTLFHDVLATGLDTVPPGIRVFLISRSNPPVAYARLLANSRIELLGGEELHLTTDETAAFVRMKSPVELSQESIRQLHQRTEGWIAGLLLLVEHGKHRGFRTDLPVDHPEAIFNYFADQVFEELDDERREFLLTTAFLPFLPVSLVQQLTGNPRAGRFLAEMTRNHYFTTRRSGSEPVYQYHQLFREFLLNRAELVYGPVNSANIIARAARLLEGAGEYSEAVALYQKADDWPSVTVLICLLAPLLLAQGRSETLREWLGLLPAEMLETNADLLYWQGSAIMATDPLASHNLLKLACSRYREQDNRAGMFLSWSAAADVTFHLSEFGANREWLDVLRQELGKDPSFPGQEVEARVTMSIFNAMAMKMTDHPDIFDWHERAYHVVLNDRSADLNQRLMTGVHLETYYIWCGNLARATMLFDFLRRTAQGAGVSDLARQAITTNEALYCFVTARCNDGIKATEETLRLIEQSGIRVWETHVMGHGVSCALSMGDIATADRYLAKMAQQLHASRRIDLLMYHTGLSWRKGLAEDYAGALEDLLLAQQITVEIGFLAPEGIAYSGLAEVLWELGRDEAAREMLRKGYDIVARIRSPLLEFFCRLVDAQMAFGRKDEAEGRNHLGQAFLLARLNGYVNKFWWRPAVMAGLCAKALEFGIETEYVCRLIRLRNLTDYPPSTGFEQWPWPVKIYALGDFRILANDEPVRFSGKVQKKPLEMLKALVALGGTEAREGQIASFLWPDADGDTARSALKTTLHRLRDLLGNDQAVQVREGRISLNRRLVWTDVGAFDQLLRSAQLQGDTGDDAQAVCLTEKALVLYRGQLLDEEGDKPWVVSPRKRLKSKFILHVVAMGNLWSQSADRKQAIACYLRGLEVDDLAEELYQNLMECYLAAGLKGEAVSTFQRCTLALAAHGVRPSAKTTALYKTMLA